jgi:hypothetical protein
MSRDNSIFFKGDTFPHAEWAKLLALYGAKQSPIDDLDRRHRITHKWWFPTADESVVHLDLKDLKDILGRYYFPDGYRWRIGIHASTGTSTEWFIYAIPIIAAVRFSDTIFMDGHSNGFVTCDLDGILLRAERVVPTRCDVEKLAEFGYIDGTSMWPSVVEERATAPPSPQTREVALRFCTEANADFYPEIGRPNNQRMHTERRWLDFFKW